MNTSRTSFRRFSLRLLTIVSVLLWGSVEALTQTTPEEDAFQPAGPMTWQETDARYAYQGPLGAELHADGSATLMLWSPMVHDVSVRIYNNEYPDRIDCNRLPMTRGDDGVWRLELDESNSGIQDLNGYFYHYLVQTTSDSPAREALDPYARSMAPFDHAIHSAGKAAIVDPTRLGKPLTHATIEGFSKPEDAIIWEIHVRDFTVDPTIEEDLNAPFGTFEAMIDKLDYIRDLGVTHIQLLPVMSYRFGVELASRDREMHYSSQDNNYNWGYDPHSYFALSGMYSKHPSDPESRIVEFKNLIGAIHERGMGVILDVVYNHTGDLSVLENPAPGYYHFMDADGTPRTSFGGGRLGTTHAMSRRLMIDSLVYWTEVFKVDGFRFDMMGDHDAGSIQLACDAIRSLNPNALILGEGWRTYAGDEQDPRKPADQDWMAQTDSVAVFSDEFRNDIKSGYGNEGEPRFITGGPRSIQRLFDNIKAQPGNFHADNPGDVVSYIAAHDNLTLHDVIALATKMDPDTSEGRSGIHRRIRIGNALLLTSQGIAFLHGGQEYGRTKQWRAEGTPEHKYTLVMDEDGAPITHPYFIHDSYDSSDAINRFDWAKATDASAYPEAVLTRRYTSGLIALRRSSDAFRLGDKAAVDANIRLIEEPGIRQEDLAIAYSCTATDGTRFLVFINADNQSRDFTAITDLHTAELLVDDDESGTLPVSDPSGFKFTEKGIRIDPLTVLIFRQKP